MMLPVHERFIKQAKKKISRDNRLTGLLAGGSMIHGAMDEYSDLDLVIVYDNAHRNEIMEQRIQLAEELEQLLSAFTGEHVGEPRLVICLYGPPLLHVDLKFISKSELRIRTENPIVLWERDEEIRTILAETSPAYPSPSMQWMEDRFWVWVHYGAAKLGRGELFELIQHITFIRNAVLGPLILMRNGHLPAGVRRLEQFAEMEMAELRDTIPLHSYESCYRALKATIKLYQRLRQASDGWIRKEEAERHSIAYLETVYSTIHK